jgi:hypothetical protein
MQFYNNSKDDNRGLPAEGGALVSAEELLDKAGAALAEASPFGQDKPEDLPEFGRT